MLLLKFLSPGMTVMRRMRFGSKLAVVSFVALIPLLLVAWQMISRTLSDLRIVRTEITGVELVGQTTHAIRLLQELRGQSNALDAIDSASHASLASKNRPRNPLDLEINGLKRLLAESQDIETPPEWTQLLSRLETLVADLNGINANQSYERYSTLIEDLSLFVYGVADKSGLLYDPDPQTYLLMDMSISKLIPLREQVDRLQLLGSGILEGSTPSVDDIGRLKQQTHLLDAWVKQIAYSQQILAREGFKHPKSNDAMTDVKKFAFLSRDRFRMGTAAAANAGDLQAYLTAGNHAMVSIDRFNESVNLTMITLLQGRENSLSRSLYFLIGGCGLAAILLVYLILSFNLSFLTDLRQVLRFMEETARGNLRHKVQIRGVDELADMFKIVGVMVNNFAFMVASARNGSALVAHAGDVLVRNSNSLSDRTEQQAANLEETTASVHELASTVQDNANAAQESDRAAQEVRVTAEQGSADMHQAIKSIEAIEASTRRMDEIVGVIDGLAFQTNILALNAAVEAARAGESGRGFAVVANEVRSLAQRSAASAKEIRQLIGSSSAQVSTGVQQIRAAAKSIAAIADGVRNVASNMSVISASSAEQSSRLSEITTAIQQLDQITQHNASMVERAVHQATALQSRANMLAESVSVFKLQQGSADEARQLVSRAMELRSSTGSQEGFIREVTARHSGLSDRDMYVFVLDHSGRYLAFAGNQAKVGTRVQDIAGIDGNALLAAIIHQAEDFPGWVEYEVTHPVSGQVQTKMSYVLKIDDAYMGCGVYKDLISDLPVSR
jgi:methyl-accepting chemotaxis protein